NQAVVDRGGDLGRHQGVVLAVVPPPLAVAAEDPGAAGVGDLGGRDVAGVGPLLRRVEVLGPYRDLALGELGDHRREEGEGGEAHRPRRRVVEGAAHRPAPGHGLGAQEVHLPVGGDQPAPPALGAHGRRSRAATPGRVLPARNSRDAPPPVETWPTFPCTPAWRAADTGTPTTPAETT